MLRRIATTAHVAPLRTYHIESKIRFYFFFWRFENYVDLPLEYDDDDESSNDIDNESRWQAA